MAGQEEDLKEYVYKVLVVGNVGTGKTAIIQRSVHHIFSDNYKTTIGVDFALKEIRWDPKSIVRLQLWDIAGQERFGSMTRVYYKEAVGAFIVFDLSREFEQSFEIVKKWKADIDSKVTLASGKPIPVVLLANKCDLLKIPVNEELMNEFCHKNGFVAWLATSAKENINIEQGMRCIIEHISKRVGEEDGFSSLPPRAVKLSEKDASGGSGAGSTGCCGS